LIIARSGADDRAHHFGFVVSTEMGIGKAWSPSSTASSRDSSCSADTLSAPGRLDSAPDR